MGGSPQSGRSFARSCPPQRLSLVVSATTGTGTNAAFRYLLPCLGSLCVITGSVLGPLPRVGRGVFGLLVWLMLDAAVAVPDHLGSQNEVAWAWSRIADQPALIGDSLDWGQDLVRLGAWVSRHSSEGPTLIRIYGLGMGEPYGLEPPGAIADPKLAARIAYLAVSEEMIYGHQITDCVTVAGVCPNFDGSMANRLRMVRPLLRIGRTIRLYRLSDSLREGILPSAGVGRTGQRAHLAAELIGPHSFEFPNATAPASGLQGLVVRQCFCKRIVRCR